MSGSTDQTKPRRSTWVQWIAGAIVFAVTVVVVFRVGRAFYYSGDYMIGVILVLVMYYAFGLLFLTLIACAVWWWRFAVMSVLSLVILILFVLQSPRIDDWAWARSINRYDQTNRQAIRAATDLPELTRDAMHKLWDDGSMPVLDGFEWYCEHHFAAPDGDFRAFRYRGVVHVRVQKIRHGWRGIALAPSPDDRRKLAEEPTLTYEDPPRGDWLIWALRRSVTPAVPPDGNTRAEAAAAPAGRTGTTTDRATG